MVGARAGLSQGPREELSENPMEVSGLVSGLIRCSSSSRHSHAEGPRVSESGLSLVYSDICICYSKFPCRFRVSVHLWESLPYLI